jgi:hypothetical protein
VAEAETVATQVVVFLPAVQMVNLVVQEVVVETAETVAT